jgi:hypothetical protein
LPQFNEPQLVVVKAQELPLSGQELVELMRAVLDKGLPFRFCARGWSMTPFIRDGDLIIVAPLRRTPPRIGEVVAFTRQGTGNLVVHRVILRRGAALLIQGDSISACSDGMILPENLLGRVTSIERNGRRVWLGLGPERFLIAWLSRVRLLIPMRTWLAACRGRFS